MAYLKRHLTQGWIMFVVAIISIPILTLAGICTSTTKTPCYIAVALCVLAITLLLVGTTLPRWRNRYYY